MKLHTAFIIQSNLQAVNDHPKFKDLVVAYRNRTTGSPFREAVRAHPTLWKIIYCMQFLSYAMSSSMLLLKFFVYSK